MYEQRFGLHRKPFQTVTKAQEFYSSASFAELLPGILHALQTDLGVAVLTGPAGTGKSVSLEQIQRKLESKTQTFLLRGGAVRASADLLYLLHRRLLKLQPGDSEQQEVAASDTVRRFEVVERLERVASFWGPLTILLDDAHLIGQEVFTELRSLLDEGQDGQRFARLLIAGPLSLEEVLADSANSHFAQKIRTHAFLQPLRSDESIQYLNHHFQLAGGKLSSVFETPALELIAAAADGIPLCLNLLADESLMVCEEVDTSAVSRDIVNRALERLQHLPYSWNVSMVADLHDDDFESSDATESCVDYSDGSSIEIGAFPSDSADDTSTTLSSHEIVSDGVIEIGALIETAVTETALGPDHVGVGADTSDDYHSENVRSEGNGSEGHGGVIEISGEISAVDEDTPEVIADSESVGDFGLGDAVEISVEDFAALQNRIADTSAIQQLATSEDSAEPLELSEFVEEEEQHSEPFGVNDGLTAENGAPEDRVSEKIQQYEAWDPAGEWLAEPLCIDGSNNGDTPSKEAEAFSQREVAFDSETVAGFVANPSQTIAPETSFSSEPSNAEAEETEANIAEVVPDPLWGNTQPVYDRFTWQELGRGTHGLESELDQEPSTLFEAVPDFQIGPMWPPVTSCSAPHSQIPVSDLDDDYAELLGDLGLLIDAVAGRDEDSSSSHFAASDLTTSDPQRQALLEATGPELAIEELQQLIESEQQLGQLSGSAEGAESVEAGTPLDEHHSPDAAPRFFSMSPAEEQTEDAAPESIGVHSESSNPDGSQRSCDEFLSQPIDGHPNDGSPEDGDPDVVAFQQVAEERDEWMDQQQLVSEIDRAEQDENLELLPGALQQARRQNRLRGQSVGLRQAAGAELAVPSPVSMRGQNQSETNPSPCEHPISLMIADEREIEANDTGVDTSSEQTDSTEPLESVGFSNLFTRLRRLRG